MACASVLQMMKFTPSMFWLNIWFTALLPPPPTPITLMMDDFSFGRSKWIITFKFAPRLISLTGDYGTIKTDQILSLKNLFSLIHFRPCRASAAPDLKSCDPLRVLKRVILFFLKKIDNAILEFSPEIFPVLPA